MRAPAARDRVGLVKAPGRQFFQRSAQSARRRFGQRRPSSPRRRCRCCRCRFACDLRSRSTCRRARCTSCTCTPPCSKISTWTALAHGRTSTWQSYSCATSWRSFTTRQHIPLQRINALHVRRSNQFFTNLLHVVLSGFVGVVLRVHVHVLHDRHVRRGLRRVLQLSRRGCRRLADPVARERRRCFSKSGILAAGRAHVLAVARPAAVCVRRLPPQGARNGSNSADHIACTRTDSALIACARTGSRRLASGRRCDRPPPHRPPTSRRRRRRGRRPPAVVFVACAIAAAHATAHATAAAHVHVGIAAAALAAALAAAALAAALAAARLRSPGTAVPSGDCARCACGRLREMCEIAISGDCSPLGRLCEMCMREIA